MLTTKQRLQQRGLRLDEHMRKEASALSAASDLFLAHSSRDKGALLDGAIGTLSDAGARVYADFLDPTAREHQPSDFGAFFAQAIEDTGRLVVLLTEQTASSRWVPWELGLGHGLHELSRIAVWPVVDNAHVAASWAEQEYLAMYPRIEWVTLSGRTTWGVRDPRDNKCWKLPDWVKM